MANDFLRPVSYHLRNFGQYTKLDLTAADAGNLTLLGANAVGKTTLANCFYPLLIDGSIATPNFNPARSSDAVSQTTDPRNTVRDKRTFNSMLLGWGKAKFAVRTGYTYMQFASAQRQIVLGIGAHRQTDGYKSATWWFVLESADVEALVCCDASGGSLERQEFQDANAGYGAELQIFTQWQEYRNFVAVNVYGFDSGEALGKLANAYRLLASPILTGGNARFAPIPNALRMAQEPIDRDQIIVPLAMSQRHLNQTLARQHELQNGLERLDKIKKALFWGNLNRLNYQDGPQQGFLPTHVSLVAQSDAAKRAILKAEAEMARIDEQLNTAEEVRDQAENLLQVLQAKLAEQASLERLRADLDRQIADWREQLALNKRQLEERTDDEALVARREQTLVKLTAEETALLDGQLKPLIAQLHGQSANLPELSAALAETTNEKIAGNLQHYVRTKQTQLQEHQHLAASIERTSDDVALVVGMQGEMGTALDTRLTGRRLMGVHDDLSADNQRIHEAGAAKMNQQVPALQAKQQALLDQAPDLKAYLEDGSRLSQLQAASDQLRDLLKQLNLNRQAKALAQEKLSSAQQQLVKLLAEIDENFDPEVATSQIEVLTADRDDLQVDPTLEQQVAVQKEELQQYDATISQLRTDRGKQQADQRSSRQRRQELEAELTTVDERINDALSGLRQLAPEETELDDIITLLSFVRSNGAKIRSHPYMQLGDAVRNAVTGNTGDPSLDALFVQQEAPKLAASLREARTVERHGLLVVPFDLAEAIKLFETGLASLKRAVEERTSGQSLALQTYLNAAAIHVAQQYQLIPKYNKMLSEGIDQDGIRLEVRLEAIPGHAEVAVAEAKDLKRQARPALETLVQSLIDQLVNNPDLASDEEAFLDAATERLDTRLWSEFKIYIYRRHSDEPELVNDAFVQSGGSGAEKAQAMVLPLLLVPKLRLRQAQRDDAPHLVMFDEFADKLDPETARAFAKTIDRFEFNFIATMPSGAQSKILADGVANRAYEVMAPTRTDGRFHANQVHEVMQWHAPREEAHE